MKQHRIILHVVPCDEDESGLRYRWEVKVNGWPTQGINGINAPRPEFFRIKDAAIRAALYWAKQWCWLDKAIPAQVLIHNRDGKISREMSYGANSTRRKG